MPASKNRPTPDRTGRLPPRPPTPALTVDPADLEFHREGTAWLWDGGTAFLVRRKVGDRGNCTCGDCRDGGCRHLRTLAGEVKGSREEAAGKGPFELFRESVWYGLASALAEGGKPKRREISLAGRNEGPSRVLGPGGEPLAECLSDGPARQRFSERCAPPGPAEGRRGASLEALARLTLTEDEQVFVSSGAASRRQALEGSLGYRLAYHGYRELGSGGSLFSEAVEQDSGTYWLSAHDDAGRVAFRAAVPADKVERARATAGPCWISGGRIAERPDPVEARYRVEPTGDHGLVLRLAVPDPADPARLLSPLGGECFRFGGLVYLPDRNVFVQLAEPEPLAKRLRGGVVATVERRDVPEFLKQVEGLPYLLGATDRSLRIHRSFDRVEVFAEALDRSWLWISVRYGLGAASLSLEELTRARAEGRAYVEVEDGWLDCRSPDLDGIEELGEQGSEPGRTGTRRVSRPELLRLARRAAAPVRLAGDPGPADPLRRLLDLAPAAPLPELVGLTSTLRPYQRTGAEWLVFLWENGLGGLLCDDMGLGKTHQVMALMVYLRECAGAEEPFLVVCPATVLSHWEAKLKAYAPGLPVALHHGGERDLEAAWKAGGVVLTSYGILRNDAPFFAETPFALAVFDEAQHLKNAATVGHEAARGVMAPMKLAVTGTPVENSLSDLKALLDLTVPGYLGSDRDFLARYEAPAEAGLRAQRRAELARLVSPFTLRRMKQTVLAELPDKIEDLRTCSLSDEQVRLYRDALARRSPSLLAALGRTDEPVPYVHVFALLSLLKQICDHPALVEPSVEGYERLACGKWDLFTELLAESLDSGQKVVVFSHFLGMIEIMERHLKGRGVGHVSLTGRSRNRGKLLERFHEDPECRVFLASLKAGGAGIDLVAGSVVIHYDRWWNAAAEDQATDRVHRIGQTRGVQVFKLVTEGTLEEKISAIIDRKRALLRDVVAEDDPGLLKSFSRDEILGMLAGPG